MFDVTGAETAALRELLWASGAKALAVEKTAAAAATVAKERMVAEFEENESFAARADTPRVPTSTLSVASSYVAT